MSRNVDFLVHRRIKRSMAKLIAITICLKFKARCKMYGKNIFFIHRNKLRLSFTSFTSLKYYGFERKAENIIG